jgi:tungstate transport system permease protein
LGELWDAFVKALHLIVTFDHDVMDAARVSLTIAAISCSITALLCLPLGSLIHFRRFPGKRLLTSAIQTLFSLPTVSVGLIIFVVFSRAGPLGGLGIFLTPTAMVLGQIILISPVMLGLIISALSGVDKAVPETATSLGASRFQAALITIREARFAIMAAVIAGFGRAFAEVGVANMVGGNFAGYTRTLTTDMMLQTQMGNTELALALGIILILIALVINVALNRLQQR